MRIGLAGVARLVAALSLVVTAAAGCHMHLHTGEVHYHGDTKEGEPRRLIDTIYKEARDGDIQKTPNKQDVLDGSGGDAGGGRQLSR